MSSQTEILQFVVETSGDEKMVALARATLAAGEAGAEATPQMAALVAEFDRLTAQDKLITKFVTEKAAVAELGDQMNLTGARLNELSAKIASSTGNTAGLQRQYDRTQTTLQDLNNQLGKHEAALAATGNALTAAGVDTTKLETAQRNVKQALLDTAVSATTLGNNVKSVGSSSGVLSSLGVAASEVGKSFKSAGETVLEFTKKAAEITGITALLAGLAAAVSGFEFFKKGAEEAAQFDTAMAKLAVTSGATGEELTKLKEAAEEAANSTNTGAAAAATALSTLTSQLGSSDAALKALEPTLLLAKAGQIELGTAVSVVTESLKAFHDPALTASDIVDTLSAVSVKTGADLGAITNAFQKLAPQATELGLSFKDTVAALGLLQTRGIDASVATKSLSTVFSELNNPTSKLRGELVGLGIDTSSLSTIIDGLAKAGPRGEEALLSLGAKGSNALIALVQAGVGGLSKFEASLGNISGAAKKTADAIENNLSSAAKNFSTELGNLAGNLEEGAFAPLTKEVQSLTDRLKSLPQTAGFAQIKQAISDFTSGAIAGFEKLIGSIDFKAAGQNISSFITDAGANFKGFIAGLGTIGTVASAVGNAISIAFNGVKTVFFTVGAAASATIAVLLQGLAAVTQIAGGSLGVVEALREKANDYIEGAKEFGDRAAESARNAATGITKIADAVLTSGDATADAAKKLDEHTQASERNAEQAAKLKAAYDLLPDSVKKLFPPVAQLSASLEKVGDDAGKVPVHFKAAADAAALLGTRSGLTKQQLLDLQAAFSNLGVVSQATLSKAASDAKNDFDTITKASDGSAASVANVQNAFLKYAEAALASTVQLSDSEKLKVQADLDSKASTLGVTEALKQLEATSASSAPALVSDAEKYAQSLRDMGDAALQASLAHQRAAHDQQSANAGAAAATKENVDADHAAEKSFTEYGDAANAAALATRGITADTSHANDGMQRLTQAIGEARAGFLSISTVAAAYYDNALKNAFAFATESDSAAAGFERAAKAIQAAADQTNAAITSQRNQIAGEVEQINQIGTSAKKSFGSFGDDAETATKRMGQLESAIASGKLQMGLLGQADLAPLQQALDAARQRTQALADAAASAKQQLADLNDQLLDEIDQQNGNKTGEEDRRYQKQIQQIQDLYKQSGKLGSDEYNQAVANAKKLHELKMQQIAQEQQAQDGGGSATNTSKSGGGGLGGGGTGSGSGGGGIGGLAPVHIHIDGQQQDGKILADATGQAVLTAILRAKGNSI